LPAHSIYRQHQRFLQSRIGFCFLRFFSSLPELVMQAHHIVSCRAEAIVEKNLFRFVGAGREFLDTAAKGLEGFQ
jgi:hypothetical protein